MPFTLHAAWHRANEPFADGKFVFWAETLDFQPISRPDAAHASNASRQRQPKPPSHPGQLPIHQLRNLIAEDVSHLAVQDMQPATTTAWLPSRDGNPVARRSMVQSAGRPSSFGGEMAGAARAARTCPRAGRTIGVELLANHGPDPRSVIFAGFSEPIAPAGTRSYGGRRCATSVCAWATICCTGAMPPSLRLRS